MKQLTLDDITLPEKEHLPEEQKEPYDAIKNLGVLCEDCGVFMRNMGPMTTSYDIGTWMFKCPKCKTNSARLHAAEDGYECVNTEGYKNPVVDLQKQNTKRQRVQFEDDEDLQVFVHPEAGKDPSKWSEPE